MTATPGNMVAPRSIPLRKAKSNISTDTLSIKRIPVPIVLLSGVIGYFFAMALTSMTPKIPCRETPLVRDVFFAPVTMDVRNTQS